MPLTARDRDSGDARLFRAHNHRLLPGKEPLKDSLIMSSISEVSRCPDRQELSALGAKPSTSPKERNMSQTSCQITVDDQFNFSCPDAPSGLTVDDDGTIHLEPVASPCQISIIPDKGNLTGFNACKQSDPLKRDGWTSLTDLGTLGLSLAPTIWPPNDDSLGGLIFTLDHVDGLTVRYWLQITIDGKTYSHDPKIYNDPPEPLPPSLPT